MQESRIGTVCNALWIVGVVTSIVVDRGIKPRSVQTKDYKLVFTSSQLKE